MAMHQINDGDTIGSLGRKDCNLCGVMEYILIFCLFSFLLRVYDEIN